MSDDSTLLRHEDDIKGLTVLMNGIDKSLAVLGSKMEEVLSFVKNLRDLGIDVKVMDLMQRMKTIEEEHEKHKMYLRESELKHKQLTNFFTRWFPLLCAIGAAAGWGLDFMRNHAGH